MACNIMKIGGATVIMCGPKKTVRCHYCTRTGTKLCDFPIKPEDAARDQGARTCDRRLCGQCAVSVGPDQDECRVHSLRGDARGQTVPA